MSSLDSLLLEASSFISSEFNLQLQQSQLKFYSPENWQEFCQANGFMGEKTILYMLPKIFQNYYHKLFILAMLSP